MSTPVRIAITGGIGSGKSTLCHMLEAEGTPVFYCDVVARLLMLSDSELQSQIATIAGSTDRDSLRQYIGQGPEYAERINRLVWPRVREAWHEFVRTHEALGEKAIVMECALLFESGFDKDVDASVLITAPTALREERVAERDGISTARVRDIMALQLSDEEKAIRATHVITNDSTPQSLLNKFNALWKHA